MQFILMAILIVYIIVAVSFALRNDIGMIFFFMVTIMFQNIFLIMLSDHVSSQYNTIFSLVKEVMLYSSLVIPIFIRKKIVFEKKWAWIIGLFGVVILKNFFISNQLTAAMISLRQCMIPMLGVLVGMNLNLKKGDLEKILRYLVGFSMVLLLLGGIEYFILKDSFWNYIGYYDFIVNKQGESTRFFQGVTVNFYTWDFGGIPIRRLVSILADPLATAHLLYLGFLLIFSGSIKMKTNRRYNHYMLFMILLLVGAILSLSKAVFVFIAVSFVIIFYNRYGKFRKAIIRMGVILGGGMICMYLFRFWNAATQKTSITAHIDGLFNGFRNATFFGTGLGTAGVMTRLLKDNSITTSESYIGSLTQQMGFVGLAIFLVFIYQLYNRMILRYRKYNHKFAAVCIICLVSLFIEMLFSESSVSIMGTSIYFILIGISCRQDVYLENI